MRRTIIKQSQPKKNAAETIHVLAELASLTAGILAIINQISRSLLF